MNIQVGWRSSFGFQWQDGKQVVGSRFYSGSYTKILYGDGNAQYKSWFTVATITGSAYEDWMIGVVNLVYTYPDATLKYDVTLANSCCRIRELVDGNSNKYFKLESIMDLAGDERHGPPLSGLPIITMRKSIYNVFNLSPPKYPSTLGYAFATESQSRLKYVIPLGMTMGASSGLMEWTPSNSLSNGFYAVQVRVFSTASRTETRMDFFFNLVDLAAKLPGRPVLVAPLPPINTEGTVIAAFDELITLNIRGDYDEQLDAKLQIISGALPGGMTFDGACVEGWNGSFSTSNQCTVKVEWVPLYGQRSATLIFITIDSLGVSSEPLQQKMIVQAPAPEIISVSGHGSTTSGSSNTVVTIFGKKFGAARSLTDGTINIDGRPCTNGRVEVIDSENEKIFCTAPFGQGNAFVSVCLLQVCNAITAAANYMYAPPQINSYESFAGNWDDYALTLYGENFGYRDQIVTIEGPNLTTPFKCNVVALASQSHTSVLCNIPSSEGASGGPYSIKIVVEGQEDESPQDFNFPQAGFSPKKRVDVDPFANSNTWQVPSGVFEVDYTVWDGQGHAYGGKFSTLPTTIYTLTTSGATAATANSCVVTGGVMNLAGTLSATSTVVHTLTKAANGAISSSYNSATFSPNTDNLGETQSFCYVRFVFDNPCDPPPNLLEKKMTPILLETSGFVIENNIPLLRMKVLLPSYYYNTHFGYNHADVEPVGVNEQDQGLARKTAQCPNVPVATPQGYLEGMCNRLYTIDVAYTTECPGFVQDSTDSANLKYTGTLWVVADTVLVGLFAGRLVSQTVMSPLNFVANLQTQITLSTSAKLINGDTCTGIPGECGLSYCNQGVGSGPPRQCGHFKTDICSQDISTGLFSSACISTWDFTGHNSSHNSFEIGGKDQYDIIRPIALIGYPGSSEYLASQANKDFLDTQCTDRFLPNYCDCVGTGHRIDGDTCAEDIEPPEWIHCPEKITVKWSDVIANGTMQSLFAGIATQIPLVRDNSYDTLSTVITVSNSRTTFEDLSDAQGPYSAEFVLANVQYEPQPAPQGVLNPFTTSVTMVTDDTENLSDTCDFLVEVIDDDPPTVTCPTNSEGQIYNETHPLLTNDWGNWLSLPTAFDQKDGSRSVTFVYAPAAQAALEAIGKYKVTVSSEDVAENPGSCVFWVYFIDEKPTISCPEPVIPLPPDSDKAVVTWSDATFDHPNYAFLVAGLSLTWSFPTTQKGGSLSMKKWVNHGSYTVTDEIGNFKTCHFDITVYDPVKPLINCNVEPSSLLSFIMNLDKDYATVDYSTYTANPDDGLTLVDNRLSRYDNSLLSNRKCGVGGASNSLNPGAQYLGGTTDITCEATDQAGNVVGYTDNVSDPCTYTITVVDTQPPKIVQCPTDGTVYIPHPVDSLTWNSVWTPPQYSDNNGVHSPLEGDKQIVTITKDGAAHCTGTSATCMNKAWPVGVYALSYTAADNATPENVNTACAFTITVEDNKQPVLTSPCPASADLCMEADQDYALRPSSSEAAGDNTGVISSSTSGPAAGAQLSQGANSFTFTAQDAYNPAVALCTWTWTVRDCQVPTIDCSQMMAGEPTIGAAAACDAGSTDATCKQYTVAIDVLSDAVKAGTGLLSSITGTYGSGWVQPTSADNVVGSSSVAHVSTKKGTLVISSSPAESARLTTGLYTVRYSATDQATGYNTALALTGPFTVFCEIQIKVEDTEAPIVDCSKAPADLVSRNIYTLNDQSYGKFYPLNLAGKAGSIAPHSSLPDYLILDNSRTIKRLWITAEDGSVVSDSDNGANPTPLNLEASNPNILSTYSYYFRAEDFAGRLAPACQFTITVVDDVDPYCSAGPNLFRGTGSIDGSIYSDRWEDTSQYPQPPEAYDNVAIMPGSYSASPELAGQGGSTYLMVGTNTISYSFADTSSNTGGCPLVITVVDDDAPRPTAGSCAAAGYASYAVDTDPNEAFALVDAWKLSGAAAAAAPTWEDNVMQQVKDDMAYEWTEAVYLTMTHVHTPGYVNGAPSPPNAEASISWGDQLLVGTHLIKVCATDFADTPNSDCCQFTISVGDKELPTITCPENVVRRTDDAVADYSGTVDLITSIADGGVAVNAASLLASVVASDNSGPVQGAVTADAGNPTFPLAAREAVYSFTFHVDDSLYASPNFNSNFCVMTVKINDREDPVIASCGAPKASALDPLATSDAQNRYYQVKTDTYESNVHTLDLEGYASSDNVGKNADGFRVWKNTGASPIALNGLTVNPAAPSSSELVAPNGSGAYELPFNAANSAENDYFIEYQVDDMPNDPDVLSATCSFYIRIVDAYAPKLDCTALANASGPIGALGGERNDDAGKPHWMSAFAYDLVWGGPSDAATHLNGDNVGVSHYEYTYVDDAVVTHTITADSPYSFESAPGGKSYNINLTVFDAAPSLSSTCPFTIVVYDREDPVHDDYTANDNFDIDSTPHPDDPATDHKQCEGGWTDSTVSDNVVLNFPKSQKVEKLNTVSGLYESFTHDAAVAIGVHTLKYTVVDTSDNVGTVIVTVTCKDKGKPVISCPAGGPYCLPSAKSVVTPLDLNPASNGYTSGQASAGAPATGFSVFMTDNYDADVTDLSAFTSCGATNAGVTAATLASTLFPIGVESYEWCGTDVALNVADVCPTTIAVADCDKPTVAASDVENRTCTDSADATCRTATSDWSSSITVWDNDLVRVTVTNSAGYQVTSGVTIFPIGVSTLTVTATDTVGSDTADFTVTIYDNAAPILTCSQDLSRDLVYTTDYNQSTFPMNVPLPSAIDNNSGFVWTDARFKLTFPNGGTQLTSYASASDLSQALPVGVTTVQWIIGDGDSPYADGNEGDCTFQITIVDKIEPQTNQCPAALTTLYSQDYFDSALLPNYAPVTPTFAAPTTWTDNITPATDLSNDFPVWGNLSKGANPFTFTSTDAANNVGTCAFTIDVVDNHKPDYGSSCPASQSFDLCPTCAVHAFAYNIQATDDFSAVANITLAALPVSIGVNVPGESDGTVLRPIATTLPLAPGAHQFSFRATDESNNSRDCIFTITVKDITSPYPNPGTDTCPVNLIIRAKDLANPFVVRIPNFPHATQTAAGFPVDTVSAYFDNVSESSALTKSYVRLDGATSVEYSSLIPVTVAIVVKDEFQNYVDENGKVWVHNAITTEDETRRCSFTVTILKAYPPVPIIKSAFLNKVFVRRLPDSATAEAKYGAYLEITTGLPWPHRLYDSVTLNGVAETSVELSADCDVTKENCVQTFGMTVLFPDGCSVQEQTFDFAFKTNCQNQVNDCDATVYPDKDFLVQISLSADNYCNRNLLDVEVTATLEYVVAGELNTYIDNTLAGIAGTPKPSLLSTYLNGNVASAWLNVESTQVDIAAVALQSVSYEMFDDVARTVPTTALPAGVTNPQTVVVAGAADSTVSGTFTNYAKFARFEHTLKFLPSATAYMRTTAVATLRYNLGSQTTSGRRLLGAGRVFRKSLIIDSAPKRALLQDAEDGSGSGDMSASAEILSLDQESILAVRHADANGMTRFILSRATHPVTMTAEQAVESIQADVRAALGGHQADVHIVRRETGVITVAITLAEIHREKLELLIKDPTSTLHEIMTNQAHNVVIDPTFYFDGEVPVTQTAGGESGGGMSMAIVGGAAGGGVCLLLILFLLVRRKREAKEAKTIDDAMSAHGSRASNVSRASSHRSSRRGSRVDVAPLDYDGITIAADPSMKASTPSGAYTSGKVQAFTAPSTPALWGDSSDSD
jgi:hypothetical protein